MRANNMRMAWQAIASALYALCTILLFIYTKQRICQIHKTYI